jgi:hypothetical protein
VETGGSVTVIAVLRGIHPRGKQGDSFAGYGIADALAALADARVDFLGSSVLLTR